MLYAPFSIRHLSDPFGDWPQWRKNMGLGPHRGTDWNGLAEGTPIPASGAGRVVWRTNLTPAEAERTALGHRIVIAYPVTGGEIRIGYSHLAASPTLGVGAQVVAGQTVGLVGNTGTASTGAHLHMTASWQTGDPGSVQVVDPMKFLTFASASAGVKEIQIPEEIMADAFLVHSVDVAHGGVVTFAVVDTASGFWAEFAQAPRNGQSGQAAANALSVIFGKPSAVMTYQAWYAMKAACATVRGDVKAAQEAAAAAAQNA